jgi:hypothetical protein
MLFVNKIKLLDEKTNNIMNLYYNELWIDSFIYKNNC